MDKRTLYSLLASCLPIGGGILIDRLSDTFYWLAYLLIGLGVVGVILTFWSRKSKRDSEVEVVAKIDSIRRVTDTDVAFGDGERGHTKVYVDVSLNAKRHVDLDRIEIDICGQRTLAYEKPVERIIKAETYPVLFQIPNERCADVSNARVYVYTEGGESHSEPFTIRFTEVNP